MDVAATLVRYLSAHTDVSWYHDKPTGRVPECGTVTRDGGPSGLVEDSATVTLMAYAPTRGRAADLAWQAKQALVAMPWWVENVFGAEVLGDYYDPLDGQHRHRVTARVTVN